MKSLIYKLGLVCLLLAIILPVSGQARAALEVEAVEEGRAATSAVFPHHDCAVHSAGNMLLMVTNFGIFGNDIWDPFGEPIGQPSCEYPKGSNSCYLFGGAFWVGAIVGQDTLVSVGHDGWSYLTEMNPDEFPDGAIIHRSLNDPLTPDAVSEEDIIGLYYDTLVLPSQMDEIDERLHVPLGIQITQNSYAWSYPHADDFVLFDLQIENIGVEELHDVYIGIYVDGDAYIEMTGDIGYNDDICGFLPAALVPYGGCVFMDTVNMAWIADNDGDPNNGVYDAQSVPHVTATSLLRTPSPETNISFNWWVSSSHPSLDFGPRERAYTGAWEEPFRDFTTGGLGTPSGDRNKYYLMRNREFDYDQIYTAAIGADDPLWMEPSPTLSMDFSDGVDTRYLLSFGPFDISPGQSMPLSFAYVGGMDLHTDPNNLQDNLHDTYDPATFYSNLSFSDLVNNRRWASWVYDTPGYDTDGDGYKGKYHVCCDTGFIQCEAFYYEGDGVPDFKAAYPPHGPTVRVDGLDSNRVFVSWNGLYSESMPDAVTQVRDFEGYNAYFGIDDGTTNLALIASYDKENFTKFVWVVDALNPDGIWRAYDNPYLTSDLRCLYASSCEDLSFDPADCTSDNPLVVGDSLFYFAPVGINASEFGVTTPIEKTYPDQPYPSTLNPAEANPSELTEDGYLKYFEYQLMVSNLIAEVMYCFGVTATDFGFPQVGVAPFESSVDNSMVCTTTPNICCVGMRGNVDGSDEENPDISDLIYLVNYVYRDGEPPECVEEANTAGGIGLDMIDIVALVNYMFRGGPLFECP